ncbi:MAG: hypothetical protein ACOYJA_06015 [Christensenellales bacterium]|jgi:hypothetical protein
MTYHRLPVLFPPQRPHPTEREERIHTLMGRSPQMVRESAQFQTKEVHV